MKKAQKAARRKLAEKFQGTLAKVEKSIVALKQANKRESSTLHKLTSVSSLLASSSRITRQL